MKKVEDIVVQILLMVWPDIAALILLLGMKLNINRTEPVILWGLLVLIILLLIYGGKKAYAYRTEKQCFRLSLFGTLQKLSILHVGIAIYKILDVYTKILSVERPNSSGDGIGALAMLIYAFSVGVAVILAVGILVACMFAMFVESAIYMCCAVSVLAKELELSKAHKILLMIGNCIPVVDVVCAIIILVMAKKCKNILKSC